jgi:pimeloyl-ACP methyl ester carboxylesterase
LQGKWETIRSGDHVTRVYDLPGSVHARGAVVFLHNLDELTLEGNAFFSSLFDKHRIVCVCPHGDGAWWLDRIWPAFDPNLSVEAWVIEQVVPVAQLRWRLGPRSMAVFGIGMGGQGALRMAFRHPERFPVVAGINAMLDFHELYHSATALDEMYDSKEQCRQDTALLHIHPANFPPHIFFACDPANGMWLRGNDRLHEKLTALGIAHEADMTTSAVGASWPYAELLGERVMTFVAKGIEEQSRRIL